MGDRRTLRVLVVQHGEKERRPGDPGLTSRGRDQARRTATWLRTTAGPVSAVWSSPLRRARETAAPIATACDVAVVVDPRLRERMNWGGPGGPGSSGETLEAFLDEWRRASADRSYVPRSGDSSVAAAARFLAALGDLAVVQPAGTVVVVAHGGVTTDVLRTVLGDDELVARAPTLIDQGIAGGAVTTFERRDDGWRVPSIAVEPRS